MTEYRIVATIEFKQAQKEPRRLEAAEPFTANYKRRFLVINADNAEFILEKVAEECAEYDAENSTGRGFIEWVRHSNIRLQSREITDWEDTV